MAVLVMVMLMSVMLVAFMLMLVVIIVIIMVMVMVLMMLLVVVVIIVVIVLFIAQLALFESLAPACCSVDLVEIEGTSGKYVLHGNIAVAGLDDMNARMKGLLTVGVLVFGETGLLCATPAAKDWIEQGGKA